MSLLPLSFPWFFSSYFARVIICCLSRSAAKQSSVPASDRAATASAAWMPQDHGDLNRLPKLPSLERHHSSRSLLRCFSPHKGSWLTAKQLPPNCLFHLGHCFIQGPSRDRALRNPSGQGWRSTPIHCNSISYNTSYSETNYQLTHYLKCSDAQIPQVLFSSFIFSIFT